MCQKFYHDPYWNRDWHYTSPFLGEAWHSDIPKRKSGGLRDPSQRRIAVYNLNYKTHFKRSWQSELLVHPRHVRWAARKRIGYSYASPMLNDQEKPIFLD